MLPPCRAGSRCALEGKDVWHVRLLWQQVEDADLHEGFIAANFLPRRQIQQPNHEQTKTGWVRIHFCSKNSGYWWGLPFLRMTLTDILRMFAWLDVTVPHRRYSKMMKFHWKWPARGTISLYTLAMCDESIQTVFCLLNIFSQIRGKKPWRFSDFITVKDTKTCFSLINTWKGPKCSIPKPQDFQMCWTKVK